MSDRILEVSEMSISQLKNFIKMFDEIKAEMIESGDCLSRINSLLDNYNQELNKKYGEMSNEEFEKCGNVETQGELPLCETDDF